jgi:hypothetical protein
MIHDDFHDEESTQSQVNTHGHLSPHAFVWHSFQAQTSQVAKSNHNIWVEDQGG